MKNRLNRGFTLIELLVVIAIIGILSSVVLASLNTARSKGADAAVKSNLNNVRAQAELFYDGNVNSYAGVCVNGAAGTNTIGRGVQSAITAGGEPTAVLNTRCGDAAGTWAAWTRLKSDTTAGWCVDSTGTSKLIGTGAVPAAAIPAGAVQVCP